MIFLPKRRPGGKTVVPFEVEKSSIIRDTFSCCEYGKKQCRQCKSYNPMALRIRVTLFSHVDDIPCWKWILSKPLLEAFLSIRECRTILGK